MSEMIDGYTAQKIRDYWLNRSQGSNSDHSMCIKFIENLQKELDEVRKQYEAARRLLAKQGHTCHTKDCACLLDAEQEIRSELDKGLQ